jgi:hypothetical protein
MFQDNGQYSINTGAGSSKNNKRLLGTMFGAEKWEGEERLSVKSHREACGRD